MHDHASHHHGHHHGTRGDAPVRRDYRNRLLAMLALSATYMFAEAIGGWLTGSLALLADAAHMLSDVAALGLSAFAAWISRRPATSRRTYGYYRTEILAALANGAALIAIAILIIIEAIRRFAAPPEVMGGAVMAIATGGLVVNLIGLWVLHGGRHENLNVHGAWLHVFSDALGSVGAIIAGGLIWAFDWRLADPMASVAVALLVMFSATLLLREAVSVLMESAPRGIDADAVREAIASMPGVLDVHDLHLWSITTHMPALSAHVVCDQPPPAPELLRRIQDTLHDRFGIDHVTIQLEPRGFEERKTLV